MRNFFSATARMVGFLAGLAALVLLCAGTSALAQDFQAQEEKVDYYQRWLREDVAYIITEEEREVFEELSTAEEKDAFIEQFWRRRDKTPGSGANETRQEHYRRIAYANEHFKSGIDGWATDRGRIYIVLGPPDSIERHPTGGRYARPLKEGGGTTTALPYEVWTYNYVEHLGRAAQIEFVDPLSTGEYRIALHDSEKDALLYVGGQGQTLGEQVGLTTRAGRIRNAQHMRGLGLEGDSPLREGDNPFERLQSYFDLRRPPQFRFPDLQAHTEVRVSYQSFPLQLQVHRMWMTPDRVLAAASLHLPASQVRFQRSGLWQAEIDLYGEVETLGGRIDYQFEDRLLAHSVDAEGDLVYQKKIPLEPGRYKLTLVARDAHSGKLATAQTSIRVPEAPDSLWMSDVVLASQMRPMPGETGLSEAFATRMGLKVYPQARSRFPRGSRMAFAFEVYGFAADSSSGKPDVDWSYALAGEDVSWQEAAMHQQRNLGLRRDALTAAFFVTTADLEPGRYQLLIEVRDRISGQSVRSREPFQVVEVPSAGAIQGR
ncbi:MAG TPA: GWxTD domain-containing protein [Acidobacteriota bacterium]|nr:GWxTD domain-containing protein [Acidobacteriota bacterium]